MCTRSPGFPLLAILMAALPARAQTPQFVNKAAETLEFTGFIQPRWQYTTEEDVLPNNTFRLRRAEVYLKPALNARIKSTIGMDKEKNGWTDASEVSRPAACCSSAARPGRSRTSR